MSADQLNTEMERLAIKTICAADMLKKIVKTAEEVEKIKKRVNRYVRQLGLILTWKRGSGVLKMAGSAAKTVGSMMVVVAPLHPKLSLAVRVGHKLWKLGTALKVLNIIGGMLRDVWHNGCRSALTDFTLNSALLTRNIGVFRELIQDLHSTTLSMNNNNLQAPEQVLDLLKEFIPGVHAGYVTHVINILFSHPHYSPLFDFIALTSDSANTSNVVQIMRELESFHFTEFVDESDSKALVAVGSFLHVSRELLDFLDGFQKFTDKDCHFLQECLSRLTEESASILKVVALLTNLDKIRKAATSGACANSQDNQVEVASMEQATGTSVQEHEESHVNVNLKDSTQEAEPVNLNVNNSTRIVRIVEECASGICEMETDEEINTPSVADASPELESTVKQSQIVEHSRMLLSKTLDTFSLAMGAVSKGTSFLTTKRRKTVEAECSEDNQSMNRI